MYAGSAPSIPPCVYVCGSAPSIPPCVYVCGSAPSIPPCVFVYGGTPSIPSSARKSRGKKQRPRHLVHSHTRHAYSSSHMWLRTTYSHTELCMHSTGHERVLLRLWQGGHGLVRQVFSVAVVCGERGAGGGGRRLGLRHGLIPARERGGGQGRGREGDVKLGCATGLFLRLHTHTCP